MILNPTLLPEAEENQAVNKMTLFWKTEPNKSLDITDIWEKWFDKVINIDNILDITKIETRVIIRSIVEANTLLDDIDRIKKAEELLGPLTQQKKDAILQAHNAGNGSVYNYKKSVLRDKAIILKKATITREERRILIENGIVGKTKAAPKWQGPLTKYENELPQTVANSIKGEREIISNPKTNLEELTKNLTLSSERHEIEIIEMHVNGWVEMRLYGINNLLEYTENCTRWLPESEWFNGRLEIRKRALETFNELLEHVNEIELLKWVRLSDELIARKKGILERFKK